MPDDWSPGPGIDSSRIIGCYFGILVLHAPVDITRTSRGAARSLGMPATAPFLMRAPFTGPQRKRHPAGPRGDAFRVIGCPMRRASGLHIDCRWFPNHTVMTPLGALGAMTYKYVSGLGVVGYAEGV